MFVASRPVVCLVFTLVFVSRASAQPADTVGVRAQGMGGAFTAVADDATASWWNPAGIAGGAFFNLLLDGGTHSAPPDDPPAGPSQRAWRAETRSFAASFPALGLSYYRLRISEIQPTTTTAAGAAVRQEEGATGVRLRSVVLNQFGGSIGQSLGDHFVVGSTLKVVHGGAGVRSHATGSLDEASGIDPAGETKAGIDLGAMAVFGPAKVGLMVRNVVPLEFGAGPDAFTWDRSARIGVAVTSSPAGVFETAVIAVDADLTKTPTALGDERRVATGGEVWTTARTIGLRGGFGLNTIGTHGASVSGGLSAALKKGMYVDGELTGGTDEGRKGWSIGLRVTF